MPSNPLLDYCFNQTNNSWTKDWYLLFEKITAISQQVSDPGVARLKLQWWRDEIARFSQGEAKHPLCTNLQQQAFNKVQVKTACLALIDALDMEIHNLVIKDWSSLEKLADQHTGNFVLCLISDITELSPETTQQAKILGREIYLANKLIQFGWDIRQQRCYMPLDFLQQQQLTATVIAELQTNEAIKQLLSRYQQQLKLQQAEVIFKNLPSMIKPRLLPLFITLKLQQALLSEIKNKQYALLEQQILLPAHRLRWLHFKSRFIH